MWLSQVSSSSTVAVVDLQRSAAAPPFNPRVKLPPRILISGVLWGSSLPVMQPAHTHSTAAASDIEKYLCALSMSLKT